MISFRYHVVSLVAVFLALALGIVVGTTALNGPVTTDLRHQVDDLKKRPHQLADQVKALQAQVDDAGQFATTFGAQLVAGTLKDQRCWSSRCPAPPPGCRTASRSQLTAAGARSPAGWSSPPSFTDPAAGRQHHLAGDRVRRTRSTSRCPTRATRGLLGGALLRYVLVGHGEATDLRRC